MKIKSTIPNIISFIRILLAPIFFYTFLNDLYIISIILILLAIITDVLDGYIARKMSLTSDMGAYLDVTADFILIIIFFSAYIIRGWYNPLILLLIITMFILFIGTSNIKKPVYDPVGKYLGAYLMVMIFISLLFQETLVRQILLSLLVLLSLLSIISRLFYLRRSNAPH